MIGAPLLLLAGQAAALQTAGRVPFLPNRGQSRFFLDTASVDEYKALLPLGLFHGVTSNPSILERDGVPCTVAALHALADKAFAHGVDEFMCQAWGGTVERYVETGLALRAKDPERFVIKLPVNMAGVEAASKLQAEGVRICLTACYASHQALIAGSAGVEYIAPYLGRMSDNGKDGLAEIIRMQEIVDGLGVETRVLVASIRDVDSMAALACKGCDTFTFSPAIARKLFEEPLTDAAAADFEKAARSRA